MLLHEPVKGKFYAVLSRDNKGRVEGLTIGRFIERQYCGCELHGDRLGYSYLFAKNDITNCVEPNWMRPSNVFVKYDENEKDFSKVIKQLQQYVIPLPDGFNPFEIFEKIQESKAA